jgi:hypothetical protein
MSTETHDNDQNQTNAIGLGGKNKKDAGQDIPNVSRRNVLKLGAAGAGIAVAAAGGAFVLKKMEGTEHDDRPNPIDK